MKLRTRTNQPVEGDELDNLKLSGDLELEGDMSVDEDSKVAIFENIVDKNGHPRFIEGNITIETFDGITKTFGKWSLSGTHLMIVVACDVDQNKTISGTLCFIDLPQWIKDKIIVIYPLYYTAVISNAEIRNRSNGSLLYNLDCYLRKEENSIYISFASGSYTSTQDALFRIELDLLIDNE